jgi:hypothetical protein
MRLSAPGGSVQTAGHTCTAAFTWTKEAFVGSPVKVVHGMEDGALLEKADSFCGSHACTLVQGLD